MCRIGAELQCPSYNASLFKVAVGHDILHTAHYMHRGVSLCFTKSHYISCVCVCLYSDCRGVGGFGEVGVAQVEGSRCVLYGKDAIKS